MCALIVGHQRSSHIMLLGKSAVIVQSGLVELAVETLVVLRERYLCRWIDGIGVGSICTRCGIIGIERHRRAVGLTNLTVIVECSAQISAQALHPGNLPTKICRDGRHLIMILTITAQPLYIDKGVASVGTGQHAIGKTKHLNRRIAVGCINRGIAAVLGSRLRTVDIHRKHQSLGQRGIQLSHVVQTATADTAIESLRIKGNTSRNYYRHWPRDYVW